MSSGHVASMHGTNHTNRDLLLTISLNVLCCRWSWFRRWSTGWTLCGRRTRSWSPSTANSALLAVPEKLIVVLSVDLTLHYVYSILSSAFTTDIEVSYFTCIYFIIGAFNPQYNNWWSYSSLIIIKVKNRSQRIDSSISQNSNRICFLLRGIFATSQWIM